MNEKTNESNENKKENTKEISLPVSGNETQQTQQEIQERPYRQQKSVVVKYSLDYNQAMKTLTHFDNLKNGTKKAIYTILLSALGFYFFWTATTNTKASGNFIVGTLCFAVLAIVWLTPFLTNRRTAKGFASLDSPFTMVFYQTGVGIGKGYEETFVEYSCGVSICKTSEFFFVSIDRKGYFGIPSTYVENPVELENLLKEKLNEKYSEKPFKKA